jgi:hypothetical protein
MTVLEAGFRALGAAGLRGCAMPDGHLRQPSCGQKLSAPARHRARNGTRYIFKLKTGRR